MRTSLLSPVGRDAQAQTNTSLCPMTKSLYKEGCPGPGAICRVLIEAAAVGMEGPMDTLHVESEAASAAGGTEQPGAAKGPAVPVDRPEMLEEAPAKPDGGAEFEACPADEGGGCGVPSAEGSAADSAQPGGAEVGHPPSLEPAVLGTVGSPPPSEGPPQRPPKLSIADLDCLICFHRYSACRLPKLLACQHAFCAVCLKLILRHEDRSWVITCPLCRKPTPVFGGLICSLRDKEDLLGRLEDPDPGAEVPRPPDPARQSQADRQAAPQGEESNRAAAKRLVLLLLLVAVLIVMVLPFLYTGLLKWALCVVAALGLLLSGLLFCNPRWDCSGLRLPPWRPKETQVASVA